MYKMCYECAEVHFVVLSVLWVILSVRYHGIMSDRENLQQWWIVVLIRVLMALILVLNHEDTSAKCELARNVPRFLGLSFPRDV